MVSLVAIVAIIGMVGLFISRTSGFDPAEPLAPFFSHGETDVGVQNTGGQGFRQTQGQTSPSDSRLFGQAACLQCRDISCLVDCKGPDAYEVITLQASGKDTLRLTFTDKAGQIISQDVYGYLPSEGVFLGKVLPGGTKRDLVINAADRVHDKDMFIINDGTPAGPGRVLKYEGTQNRDDVYRIQDVGSKVYETAYDSRGDAVLVVDGFPSHIKGAGDSSPYIHVDTISNAITTEGGGSIVFAYAGEQYQQAINVRSHRFSPLLLDQLFAGISYDEQDGFLQVGAVIAPNGQSWKVPRSSTTLGVSMDNGLLYQFDAPADTQNKLTIVHVLG